MSGNKVTPCSTEQVQCSPSDLVRKPTYIHAGEQRLNVEPKVKRDTTQWMGKDINAIDGLCNEKSEEKQQNQDKQLGNDEKQQSKTDTERTNYFGEITFSSNKKAKYIRVHTNTTKAKTVLKLMKEKWNLDKPVLLISVHGSMKGFENTSLAKTCQTSLKKAVQGTGAWVITDGIHKYVNTGEKDDEQPIIIGISHWGAIHNTHQMNTQQGTRSAVIDSVDTHHSHFILIDADGGGDTSSTARKFREDLESEMKNIESDNEIPFVSLLFEWEENIKKIDIIVEKSDKKASDNDPKSEITECISSSKSTHTREWNVDSRESDLGLAIVEELSKAAKENASGKMDEMTGHMYLLKLAVAWNMFGTAKKISVDTIKQDKILDLCMMAAILLDKADDVKQILDNGFDLKRFLTKNEIRKLYEEQSVGPFFHEVLLNMNKTKDDNNERNVGKRVKWLLDHLPESKPQLTYYDIVVIDEENEEKKKNKNIARKECICLPSACCRSKKNKTSSDTTAMTQNVCENPCLELFVWSVLNNRQDMAKLFWRRRELDLIKEPKATKRNANFTGSEAEQKIDFMMDAMAAALFAHALLSAMSDEIDDADFKEKCEKDSREFTDFATGILKEGYKERCVNLVKKLLVQQQKRWGNSSCILIAVNAKNMQFISDHVCQDVFHNIWMGHIHQETGILSNNLKLLLCTFCPFLILALVSFKKEHQTCDDQIALNSQKESGQNKKAQDSSNKRTIVSFSRQEPTICKKLIYFYKAPVVKFFHNVISYMLFLGLYSYSLMTNYYRYLSLLEIILCVWVFTIFSQEIIQVRSTPSKGWRRKLSNYITDAWNILDIFILGLFLCGMILRIFDIKQVAESAQVVHGVNLITFYLRLLHIFSVHRELGPKLEMIIQMVYNMVYFFMILVVFIVAYGIASHSILFPHTEPSLETFIEIFRRPYWNIYGELMLDTIAGSADCTNDPELYKTGSYSRCPTESGQYVVPLMLGAYMLMCNILLLNLLIAMFSFTFENVQKNSYLFWCFQQYSLINEYANRPILAPPLIILEHLYQLCKWIRSCWKKKSCKCNDERTVFRKTDVVFCDKDNRMVETFYKNGKMRMENNSSNVIEANSSANVEKRMEQMEKQLDRLVQMQRENTKILEKLGSSKV